MKEYLNGLQHIGLPVRNYTESCMFYEKLGFENIYETRQPSGGKVAFYRMDIEELPYWEHGIRFFHVKGPDGEKIEFCQKLKN